MAETTKPQPGSIGWVDLTVPNAGQVRDFYAAVTGWSPSPAGMGGYSDSFMTLPERSEPAARVRHKRGVNAELPPVWMVYIAVADLDAGIRRCRELGGKVLIEPKPMSAQSRYCVIQDPAGALCALYEAGV